MRIISGAQHGGRRRMLHRGSVNIFLTVAGEYAIESGGRSGHGSEIGARRQIFNPTVSSEHNSRRFGCPRLIQPSRRQRGDPGIEPVRGNVEKLPEHGVVTIWIKSAHIRELRYKSLRLREKVLDVLLEGGIVFLLLVKCCPQNNAGHI